MTGSQTQKAEAPGEELAECGVWLPPQVRLLGLRSGFTASELRILEQVAISRFPLTPLEWAIGIISPG